MELAEIKQNLWRTYRDGNQYVIAPPKPRDVPEGRKVKPAAPIIRYYFEGNGQEKKRRTRQVEDHWEKIKTCVDYTEKNKDWLIASRLERSYQEEEREKMWET